MFAFILEKCNVERHREKVVGSWDTIVLYVPSGNIVYPYLRRLLYDCFE